MNGRNFAHEHEAEANAEYPDNQRNAAVHSILLSQDRERAGKSIRT